MEDGPLRFWKAVGRDAGLRELVCVSSVSPTQVIFCPRAFRHEYGVHCMGMLNKAWITPHDAGLVALSLESKIVDREYAQFPMDGVRRSRNGGPWSGTKARSRAGSGKSGRA